MHALKIDKENGRILYASVVLACGNYDGMPLVEELPDGDISEYRYIDGHYIHDPLPIVNPVDPAPTPEERIAALEEESAQLKEALELLLSGDTEEVNADG